MPQRGHAASWCRVRIISAERHEIRYICLRWSTCANRSSMNNLSVSLAQRLKPSSSSNLPTAREPLCGVRITPCLPCLAAADGHLRTRGNVPYSCPISPLISSSMGCTTCSIRYLVCRGHLQSSDEWIHACMIRAQGCCRSSLIVEQMAIDMSVGRCQNDQKQCLARLATYRCT